MRRLRPGPRARRDLWKRRLHRIRRCAHPGQSTTRVAGPGCLARAKAVDAQVPAGQRWKGLACVACVQGLVCVARIGSLIGAIGFVGLARRMGGGGRQAAARRAGQARARRAPGGARGARRRAACRRARAVRLGVARGVRRNGLFEQNQLLGYTSGACLRNALTAPPAAARRDPPPPRPCSRTARRLIFRKWQCPRETRPS